MMQKSAEYLWEAAHKTGPWEHQGPPWSWAGSSQGEKAVFTSYFYLVQEVSQGSGSNCKRQTYLKWFYPDSGKVVCSHTTRMSHTPFLCHNYPFKERSQTKTWFCGENSLTADSTSWQACWVLLPLATDYTITLGHWLGLRTLSVRTLSEEIISWNPGKIRL